MRRCAFLVLVHALSSIEHVYGEVVVGDGEGFEVADESNKVEVVDESNKEVEPVPDGEEVEPAPDGEDLDAPQEDLALADKIAAEGADESENDVDGSEEETEAQDEAEEMDTFTDSVQSQPADGDESKQQETVSETLEQDPADEPVKSSDEPVDTPADADDDSFKVPEDVEDVALTGTIANTSSGVVADEESTMDKFEPYDGMEIPPPIETFPGCTCDFDENKRRWKCGGTIAHPESVAGDPCCCCTLKCKWKNRCSNEQCEAIGVDQAEEVAAEEKRMAELLKGADFLLGEDLPGFEVKLINNGQCKSSLILASCQQQGLTPLCDHPAYSSQHKCYTPPGIIANRHFSHWSGHRQVMKLDVDDDIFYGMCFYTTNGDNALYATATSHAWATGGTVRPRPGLSKQFSAIPIAKMNDGTGELGGWRTICVKEDPNKVR